MTTLLSPTRRLFGHGIHSGLAASIQIVPLASTSSGVWFCDERFENWTLASYKNVSGTTLQTTLGNRFRTVEHVLSALFAMHVDHALCVVETASGEIPIMDGSSLPFVHALAEAQVYVDMKRKKKASLIVKKPVRVERNDKSFVLLEPINEQELHIDVTVEFPNGRENHKFVHKYDDIHDKAYISTIAGARTFVMEKDVENMLRAGLGLGGTKDNCVVYCEDGSTVNTEMRYPNERVRHKILDVLGDLSLCEYQLKARYSGFRTGHAINLACLVELFKDTANYEIIS